MSPPLLWMTRVGAPWRDLAETFGNWTSVFKRFRRWPQKAWKMQPREWVAALPLPDRLTIARAQSFKREALLTRDRITTAASYNRVRASVSPKNFFNLVDTVREDWSFGSGEMQYAPK